MLEGQRGCYHRTMIKTANILVNKTARLFSAVLLVLTLVQSASAASHIWSGAVNGLWSNAGNWSSGGVPVIGEANIALSFPGGATRTVMTNDIGALNLMSMNFSGSNYVVRGGSAISFNTSALLQLLCSGNSNIIESTLNLSNFFTVSVADNRVMAFHTLTGPGTLTKFGEGQLHLRGGAANSLSGGYTVSVGALHLEKTGGATAVAGPLTIIGTTNFGELASVRLFDSEQIAGNVNVTIHRTALLNLNGFTNTINNLTVMAGTVYGSGLLRLNGAMNLSAQDNTFPATDVFPLIQTDVEFLGASTTITVSNLTCEIEGDIVEYGGTTVINKAGPGTLWLKGGGNNPGAINVIEGGLRAEFATSLGTAVGNTTVGLGATLTLGAGMTTSESLVLSNASTLGIASGVVHSFGNIGITGEVTVNVPVVDNQLLLNGAISGAGGLKKIGDGELMITGNTTNTFTGASTVAKGRINLKKPDNLRAIGSVTVTNGAQLKVDSHEQIDNAGVVSLYTGAGFLVTNFNETLGGLNLGAGVTVDTGTGTLTLLGDTFAGAPYSTTFGAAVVKGQLSLGGALRKFSSNPGTTPLTLDCTVLNGSGTGGIWLTNGDLYLLRSNSFTGPVIVNGFCGVSNSFAFGASGGGVIISNAPITPSTLALLSPTMTVTGESLTNLSFNFLEFSGTNAWNGPIVTSNRLIFSGNWLTNQMTVDASISGSGGVAIHGGRLLLLQSNTYTGNTDVHGGPLVIRHPQALGSGAMGTVIWEGGNLTLELANGAEVLGEALTFEPAEFIEDTNNILVMAGAVSNTWSGPVTLKMAAQMSVHDTNGILAINGSISGTESLEKRGPGKLILAGSNANSYASITTVNAGTLRLQKPNGVQAVSNLTVRMGGRVEWGANEQLPDGATLILTDGWGINTNVAALSGQTETITRLEVHGLGSIEGTSGTLKLHENIRLNGAICDFQPTLQLSSGVHHVELVDSSSFGRLNMLGAIHEFGGSAGIDIVGCTMMLTKSNSFSGPVNASRFDTELIIKHPQALGSAVSGTTVSNYALFYLDMPSGSVIEGESLTVANAGVPGFAGTEIRMLSFGTNTWAGPIVIEDDLCVIREYELSSRLILSGSVSGPGQVTTLGPGTLVLEGNAPNTFNGLSVLSGTVRLAKANGIPAVGGNVTIDNGGFGSPLPTVILDNSEQFPAGTTVSMDNGGTLNLNNYTATIKKLLGSGQVSIGFGTLTISNAVNEFSSFNGTTTAAAGGTRLIKHGPATQGLFGMNNLNGDVFVQNGTLGLGDSLIGEMHLAAGSVADLFAQSTHWGSLSGAGNIDSTSSPIRVGHNNASTTYSGTIFNGGATNLIKVGTGILTMTGTNTYPGLTIVENGGGIINGSLAGSVLVKGSLIGTIATLGGTGQVQNVTLDGAGAWLAPGATTNFPSYGRLNLNNLTATTGSRYVCEIGGTNAGLNLDQINASGTVTLAGGHAEFVAFGVGMVSNNYAVVKSIAPVSGIFLGDPEGDFLFPGAGRTMQITYLTAGGKEVTLSEQAGTPPSNIQIGGITAQTNGHITLSGTGTIGATYFVEANTDLNTTNWVNIGSVMGSWNGGIMFTDTNAPDFSQRFYRFRQQ